MLKGKTIGIDATTLEANAAMKSIVRRDTEESYTEYLKRLAEVAGVEASDEAALRRMDRRRKRKGRNAEWVNPHDPQAEITRMKDGGTALAYKTEHAVDIDTGAAAASPRNPEILDARVHLPSHRPAVLLHPYCAGNIPCP